MGLGKKTFATVGGGSLFTQPLCSVDGRQFQSAFHLKSPPQFRLVKNQVTDAIQREGELEKAYSRPAKRI